MEELTLEIACDGSQATVTCRGRIAYGVTARRFRACVGRVISTHRLVVLDLGRVTSIDANGLGMLAVLIRLARERGGALVLAAAAPRVARLLKLTRLDTQVEPLRAEPFARTATRAAVVPDINAARVLLDSPDVANP